MDRQSAKQLSKSIAAFQRRTLELNGGVRMIEFYKLIAFTLGYEFDEDEEMTPQIICWNGYRVRLNTYKNENLRKVHLWMMDSELDQAAGRARLLRHDCTVHVFSRFPMKQAEIVKGFAYNMD